MVAVFARSNLAVAGKNCVHRPRVSWGLNGFSVSMQRPVLRPASPALADLKFGLYTNRKRVRVEALRIWDRIRTFRTR
jgi:hypothetical protein